MSNTDPIAFTYEADVHCPDCTFKRFGREVRASRCRVCDEPGNESPWSMRHQHHRYGPRADHDFDREVMATYAWPPAEARDREGNDIGAVASWDDWCSACEDSEPDPYAGHGLVCGTCGTLFRECGYRERMIV